MNEYNGYNEYNGQNMQNEYYKNIGPSNDFIMDRKENLRMNNNKKGGFAKYIIFLVLILIAAICIFLFWYKNGIKPKKMENKDIVFDVKENTSIKDLGKVLYNNGLIKSQKAYELYVKLNKVNMVKVGKYKVNSNTNIKEILNMVKEGKVFKNDIDLTIREGMNLNEIVELVSKETKLEKEELENLLNDEEYLKKLAERYWFLNLEDVLNKDIKHPLEGYLFPDTYRFDVDKITAKEIIELPLNQMEKVLNENKKRVEEISFSPHEILTLASVIEKETKPKDNRAKVAGLFINRLNKNMPLGSDPTTHYEVGTPLSEPLTVDQLNTEGKYNTRGPNMEGKLPVGPIAMPSKSSIEAVLNYETTDALYFVSDKNGKLYFTNTLNEHENIIKKLKNENLWYVH